MKGAAVTPALLEKRSSFADAMTCLPVDPGVVVTKVWLGGVAAYRVRPETISSRRLLYFHGGGYRLGTAASFVGYCSRLANMLSCDVFVVEYRLSPEDPFPAAFNDALEAYTSVANEECDHVLIGGDSAGGGLAAALMLEVARRNLPRPAAGILLCPWVDLRIGTASYTECANTDLLWSADAAREAAGMYLVDHDPNDPRVSPVLGDWTGQPPMLLQASAAEVLRDDSRALATAAAEAGTLVMHEEFSDEQHVWHYGYATNPVADKALKQIEQFVDRVFAAQSTAVRLSIQK